LPVQVTGDVGGAGHLAQVVKLGNGVEVSAAWGAVWTTKARKNAKTRERDELLSRVRALSEANVSCAAFLSGMISCQRIKKRINE